MDIPDANSNWYTTPASTVAGNGAAYRVVVTNDSGSVTSASATLTVNAASPGPAITLQPVDRRVTAGQPVSFTVAAKGSSYQWTKNGMNIACATSPKLDIRAALSSDCGASFAALITSDAGETLSNRATLTVLPVPGAPVICQPNVRPHRADLMADWVRGINRLRACWDRSSPDWRRHRLLHPTH